MREECLSVKALVDICLSNLLVNVSVCLSVARGTLRLKERNVKKVRHLDQTVTVRY